MSFGFSLGDLVTVPSFAWNVYQSCMKSPSEARILASELHALCALLQTLSDNQQYYLEILADVQILRLLAAYKACHDVLEDTSSVLSKYSSLSTSNPKAWARLRWGTEDITSLRLRIVSSTSLLTAIQTSIQCMSQSRIPTIEQKVDQLLSRLKSLSSGASDNVLPVSRTPTLLEDQEVSRPLMLMANDHEQAISTLGQGPHILSLPGMCPVTEMYPKRPADFACESRKRVLGLPQGTAFESLEPPIPLSTAQKGKDRGSSISRFSWASSRLDALPRAAATGNVAKLQTLIDAGHPVDHVDSVHGYTALHNASMSGCVSAIKLLLSSKASVSMGDRDGATALHHAAQNGHVDASSLLVQSGSNVNVVDNSGHAPLFYALRDGHISVANALLEVGAIMAAVDDQERTHEYWAAKLTLNLVSR